MVEARAAANAAVVEGEDLLAVQVHVEVGAREIAGAINLTRQPVHALMIASLLPFATGMIRTTRYVGQRPEVIIERTILLHHEDEVIDLSEVAVRSSGAALDARDRHA
jgi:hypothetical protein